MKLLWILFSWPAFITANTFVDPSVTTALAGKSAADVFVMFPTYDFEANAHKFQFASGMENTSVKLGQLVRGVRRQYVRDQLAAFTEKSQKSAVEYLQAQGADFESFWINNSLYIKNANIEVVKTIAEMDFADKIILDEEVAEIIHPVASDYFPEDPKAALLWNLKHIRADEAWELTTGVGITVANVDTGVLYNHEALVGNYRGNLGGESGGFEHNFNWGDPQKLSPVPQDKNGHGTHTMGTIVGVNQEQNIGVAPGAKWIAARGCASSSCSQYDLTFSGQWVLCPKSLDHSEEKCELGADVSSNSWGGGRGNAWYAPVIEAWVKAGIIPVFAQGNSGDRCATANSPGDHGKVIGVGSTNQSNALSRFSSRGPGLSRGDFPLQKPDISAPGEQIYSSMNNGRYATISGTSMACPHIAGVAALILSANPNLTYTELYTALISTTQTKLGTPSGQTTCAGVSFDKFPNFHYGYGRVDAFAAVKAVSRPAE